MACRCTAAIGDLLGAVPGVGPAVKGAKGMIAGGKGALAATKRAGAASRTTATVSQAFRSGARDFTFAAKWDVDPANKVITKGVEKLVETRFPVGTAIGTADKAIVWADRTQATVTGALATPTAITLGTDPAPQKVQDAASETSKWATVTGTGVAGAGALVDPIKKMAPLLKAF